MIIYDAKTPMGDSVLSLFGLIENSRTLFLSRQ